MRQEERQREEHDRIILEPLRVNSLDELHGIFSSTPGLVEEAHANIGFRRPRDLP